MDSAQTKVTQTEVQTTEVTNKEIPQEQIQKPDLFSKEYLDKKIDELVEQRLKDRETSYQEKVAQAQKMIEEANERKALEDRLMESEKYSQLKGGQQQKEEELKEALRVVGEMGHQNMHMAEMYKRYPEYQARAARGDQRAIDMLGRMRFIHACMNHSPDELVGMLKNNLSVSDMSFWTKRTAEIRK